MKFNMCQYFGRSREEPRGGPEGSHQGPRRPPRAHRVASWLPGPTPCPPSGLYYPLEVETIKQEEFRSFAAASWQKPTEKKKPSLAGRFRRGDHLPEGEIIPIIIIIIVAGIIEIIINIIPNISTISISIPSHLTIATCVVIRTTYPLYSVGVDYYFVVNAIEFFGEISLCPDCLSPIYHL